MNVQQKNRLSQGDSRADVTTPAPLFRFIYHLFSFE
jgi:hypothetical protein